MTQNVYTTEPIVRQALQKIGEENISAEYINQAIQWASSDCDLYSGRTWLQSDQYYFTIVGCCVQLAKCYAVTLQTGNDVTQMNQFTLAIQRLTKLNEQLINTGIVEINVTGDEGIDYVPKVTYPSNMNGEVIYPIRRKTITIEPMEDETLYPVSGNPLVELD